MPNRPDKNQHHEKNYLLAQLQTAEYERLAPLLQPEQLLLGQMLYSPGDPLTHAYFPTTAIVSLHYVTESGAVAETAGVGNEGVVGVGLYLGGGSMPGSAVVQTAGYAYRIEMRELQKEFARAGSMQALLLRYTQALMTQMAQTAVCNCHHSLEQRLCRWLLLTLDRCVSDDLIITQELVAGILGVRRESITEAAGDLEKAGYISSRRGHIAVVNRKGLEATACECYAMVKKEMARLLTGKWPRD